MKNASSQGNADASILDQRVLMAGLSIEAKKLQKSNASQNNTRNHSRQQAQFVVTRGKIMKTQETTQLRDSTNSIPNAGASNGQENESVTERVASSAHETIDSAAAKAEGIEQQLREGAVKAGKKLEESQEATMAQVDKSLSELESFVKGRPIAAAGIAFVAGVLATALLRR